MLSELGYQARQRNEGCGSPNSKNDSKVGKQGCGCRQYRDDGESLDCYPAIK